MTWAAHAEADNQLSAADQAAGWRLLFDGEDLSQWRNYQTEDIDDAWRIEDGALTLTGKGGGDLITRAKFADFELALDWRISEGGNSGIFFLADEEHKYIFITAPEVQILDNERHPDNKLANHLAGSLYDLKASPAASHRPAGAWNQTRIRLQDRRLRIWHNSALVTDVVLGDARWQSWVAASKFKDWPGFGENLEGHIGLQDHGDRVQFKNIKIRTLPAQDSIRDAPT